ncbi:uncharacterized protein LOC119101363 isoform X2 [Pollicipes pollicipes]|uniref:uncharacterized protein LOC119101363 isoform X2 n=2 Tax=Pollicipes pollicipes TaxID=41117 RepID=UPI001885002F|nr:uncharacterized protein LOC119101363 isoform X2 [Pollicipes pollicipes]
MVSLDGRRSMFVVNREKSFRMLGDLPPLTNGLHVHEEIVVSTDRSKLGEANSTLPVGRVLPPLRGAPRISPSLSQEEGEPRLHSGLLQLRDAADLQSVNSSSDLRPQTGQRTNERPLTGAGTTVTEDGKGCSPLSKLFSRFRKSQTPTAHEAVSLDSPKEPKEEPDDESRPEGATFRGLPSGSPERLVASPAPAEQGPRSLSPVPEPEPPQQSKTCIIL